MSLNTHLFGLNRQPLVIIDSNENEFVLIPCTEREYAISDSMWQNIADSITWGNYYNNVTTEYTKIKTMFAIHNKDNSGWNVPQTNIYDF